MRKPDNIVWASPKKMFLFGYDVQYYSIDARCISIFIGPLTLRWHRR